MKQSQIAILMVVMAGLSFGLGVFAGQGEEIAPRGTVPMQIPYQGVLEKNGQLVNAIGQDLVAFRVSLYDAPEGGNKVWPAAPDVFDEHVVNVYNGRFSFSVGSDPAIPYQHLENTPLWVGIQVMGPGDPDFVPLSVRQHLQASPFAVAADRSDTDFYVPGQLAVSGTASLGATGVAGSLSATGNLGAQGNLNADGNLDVAGDIRGGNLPCRQTTCGMQELDVPGGMNWGSWASTTGICPVNTYVCGLRLRTEGDQGGGDDTALNDVRIICCPF